LNINYNHDVLSILQKGSSPYAKETVAASLPVGIEQEVLDADLLLPSVLPFKRTQMTEKYPKGLSRGRHWKHLKQILQAENYHLYPADETNCKCLVVMIISICSI
jgi:hypothetical protein